ncbi:hypothetical protein ABZ923_05920 [Streptomyces sp. NPDC046881]|uniref:hypothetical protein n=1 Tax=Streptomyces sp. NPDC046881 TaxID=3155374 RepID=UPI00340F36C9
MGRRGGPRPGLRFLVLGLAVPAVLSATGCAGPSGSPHSPAAATPGPGSAAASPRTPAPARPTSDAELCARLITHWAHEVLDGDSYGDYQSMGLSHGQYEILRDVVDAARTLKHRQGAAAADQLIGRQARAACTERYRHGTPSGGPWT